MNLDLTNNLAAARVFTPPPTTSTTPAATERAAAPERTEQAERPYEVRPIAHAPRLSELGTRIQEEDLTDNLLDRAFEDANQIIRGGAFSLSYSVHEDSGRVMVQVHDVDTGEIIRELPPETRLEIYARITEFTGLLFDRNS